MHQTLGSVFPEGRHSLVPHTLRRLRTVSSETQVELSLSSHSGLQSTTFFFKDTGRQLEPNKHTKETLWYKWPPFLPRHRTSRVKTACVRYIFLFLTVNRWQAEIATNEFLRIKKKQASKQATKTNLSQHEAGRLEQGYQLLV